MVDEQTRIYLLTVLYIYGLNIAEFNKTSTLVNNTVHHPKGVII
jgi:hypothetical protein